MVVLMNMLQGRRFQLQFMKIKIIGFIVLILKEKKQPRRNREKAPILNFSHFMERLV